MVDGAPILTFEWGITRAHRPQIRSPEWRARFAKPNIGIRFSFSAATPERSARGLLHIRPGRLDLGTG
jgi:hypothetical protein